MIETFTGYIWPPHSKKMSTLMIYAIQLLITGLTVWHIQFDNENSFSFLYIMAR